MLLRRLADRVSPRKHRLFACALLLVPSGPARRSDDRSRRAVQVGERLAGGLAGEEEVRRAAGEAAAAAALLMASGDLEAGAAAKACQDCLGPGWGLRAISAWHLAATAIDEASAAGWRLPCTRSWATPSSRCRPARLRPTVGTWNWPALPRGATTRCIRC